MNKLLTNSSLIGVLNEEAYMINLDSSFNLEVKENSSSTIYLVLNTIKEETLNIDIKENSNIKLIIGAFGDASYKLNVNIRNDAYLSLFLSDIFKCNTENKKDINLVGENSNFKGYEFTSSSNNKVSGWFHINHLNKNTESLSKFIFLSNNNGYINRDVTTRIDKGMSDSVSNESIKGVILDKESRIDAKPILIVDFDDVKATHGCAIGTIDSNEVYYLMSRGLSRADAMRIICKSLVSPILREIGNDEFKALIEPMLLNAIGE